MAVAPPGTPWADPGHDVLADLREAMGLVLQWRLPPDRKLHCGPGVSAALAAAVPKPPTYEPPAGTALLSLYGIQVVEEQDWQLGRWELRSDGEVIDSGRLEGP